MLGKDENKKDRLSTVLYNLIESITTGASLLEPFMPDTTEKILKQLAAGRKSTRDMEKFGIYVSGTKVTEKPEILFARHDIKEVLARAEEIMAAQAAANNKVQEDEEVINIEVKPEITFDDFGKMQFQVGEIIACEEVKKSKKLLCSKVMVLVNLKPAKLAGVLSEGMLLCAEDAEGNLALMVPEKSMPSGAEIC